MKIKTNVLNYKNPDTGEYVSVPVVVSESKEEKFELIESFEVTEEIKSLVRTTEPDGTPYDFQKIKVIVKQTKCEKTGQGGILCVNASGSLYITSGLEAFNTNYTFTQYNGYIENGLLKGSGATRIASSDSPNDLNEALNSNVYRGCPIYEPVFSICEMVKLNKIEYLRYGSLNGYSIPIGTKIDIYAVRS